MAIGKFHHLAGEVAESASPITLKLSYDKPIKTTYTFWLGAFGRLTNVHWLRVGEEVVKLLEAALDHYTKRSKIYY